MGCWSWSVPAGPEGSCVYATDYGICKSCYARANRYNTDVVAKAQWIRYQWFKNHLVEDENVLVETISLAIDKYVDNGYFRIFDSGDFSSPQEYDVWYNIIANNPQVKFWIPTRTWRSENPEWIGGLVKLRELPNLMVRPSALEFNEPPPTVDGTMVITDNAAKPDIVYLCPKSVNGSSCDKEGCRVCWESPATQVAYFVHGMMGRHKAFEVSDKMLEQRLALKERYTTITIGAT